MKNGNRFKKILIVALSLVIMITVLSVTALASSGRETNGSYSKILNAGWEQSTVTSDYQFIGSGGDDRKGYIYAMIADDGNKYVVYTPKDYTTDSAQAYIDQTLATDTIKVADAQNEGNNKTIYKYNLVDYPYVVYDFDIMTPSGTYGGAMSSFTFRAYTCKFAKTTSTTRSMVDTSKSPLQVSFSSFSKYLDKTPYEWQHVTFVMEYAPALDDNGLTTDVNFNISIYINGKFVTTTTNGASASYKAVATGILPEELGLYSIRMSGNQASYGSKIPTTDPSYVANDPTTHFKDNIAFDNTVISYYDGSYTSHDQIAAERFTEDYKLPYRYTVATLTDAEGNVTYFDDFSKALSSAVATDTLTLFENVADTCIIDKAMTVDTNGFAFNYKTTDDYMLDSSENGIYTFKYNDRVAIVKWDAPCASGCTCTPAHPLYTETSVHYGHIPTYPEGDINIPVINGLQCELLGWSYENDGTVDEITKISAAVAEAGELYLYPVYKFTQYSFETITSSGTKYYLESEYSSAIATVAKGGTIILHTDVTVANGYTFDKASKSASIVLDLNGHSFKRFSYVNTHYNAVYNSETDTWSKGAAITSADDPRGKTSGSAVAAFVINASELKFTIKSSVPGASIYTFSLFRDLWLDADGNTVGYDNVKDVTGDNNNNNDGAKLFSYKGATNTVIDIQGEGITYYGACLVYNEWGGNQNTNTFKINGGTYYVMVPTYMSLISVQAGGTVDVRNATIYANGRSFVRVANKVNTSSVTVVDFTFTNCNIIDGHVTNQNTNVGAAGIKLVNCFYLCNNSNNTNLTIDSLTYANSKALSSVLANQTATVDVSKKLVIDGISETSFVLDENLTPTFTFTKTSNEYNFAYAIANIETDCSIINWYDADGYWINTTYAIKNSPLTIPSIKVPTGDGWRGVSNITTWLDENGNVFELYVGTEDEYDLFAVLPAPEDREYVAYMTEAMFNMVYFTNFAYNVYVPKLDNVKIIKFGSEEPTKTVWIKNVEYWVYTTYAPCTHGLEETEISLEYSIEGKTYTAKFKPSAIFYANTIVSDPYAEDSEKELVGCLIRYIEESYKAFYGEIDELSQAKLDEFYSVYTPKDYVTEYPDAALFNSKPFVGLLHQVNLIVESGKVKFVFTLTDKAVELGYKIKAKGLTSALYTDDGKVFSSENTPLRTHVMETFTITIVDADGNAVKVDDGNGNLIDVTSEYSLAAYICGTDYVLAKALYAFGSALREYYPVAENNYQIKEITLFGESIKDYTIVADIENAKEYYTAEQLQALIYTRSGYWLEIVSSSTADKSIIINLTEKKGGEGFYVTFTEGRILVECEYSELINAETLKFFSSKLSKIGTVEFTDKDNTVKNIRDVFYSDFGAVGDGVTDDSEAIRAAHAHANVTRQTVCADPGATYYIGPMLSQITITSDVNWGTANFIIDDTQIGPDDPSRPIKLFNVSGTTAVTFNSKSAEVIAINNDGGLKAAERKKLDLGLGYPALVQILNTGHKNYIRYGANANSGADQQEVILIDEYGNIDPSTPLMFDYEAVTSIVARRIDTTPITIEGGIFTTKANAAPCKYTAYARNIQVTRANTTVKNITHYITDEGATGAPYEGFLKVHLAYNVTFEDCLLSGHKIYYNSEGTGMGTYDISATSSINIRWINCKQTNFFSNEAKEETTKSSHWGIMGSSYCKNLSFDGCRLTRFDAHAGVYNVKISNTEIIHITVVGGGLLDIENTTIYHNFGIQLRTDYGNFWHGDIKIKNISFRNSDAVSLITCTWYNHDFGYPTALPTNITIDGITLKTNKTINLFQSEFLTKTNSIIKDSFVETDKTGATLIKPNINPMTPPENVTILNAKNYTIVVPDKTEYPFFANTTFTIN